MRSVRPKAALQPVLFVVERGECLSPPVQSQVCPLWGQFEVPCMTNTQTLPDTTVGTGEPTASRIVLTLFFVGLLGLYSLFSNVFGWDNLPLLGEIVPLVQNLGGSGIWYYLIGFLVGVGAIVATLVGEVLAE
jgi:hypothetical protein